MRELNKNFVEVDSSLNFYDSEYATEFPVGNYILNKFKTLPSFCDDGNISYKIDVSSYFTKKRGYSYIWSYKRISKSKLITIIKVFESDNGVVFLKHKASPKNKNYSSDFNFPMEDDITEQDHVKLSFYFMDDDLLEATIKDLSNYMISPKTKSKISLVTSSRAGLSTVEQNIKPVDIDIALNYGESFIKVHDKIVDKLNEDMGKGLVLLHGVPGTGKTNYIRHLCGKLNKEIIFLPPFMAESISGPDFITFLLDHTNSVLVIEDAEKVVLDRDGDSGSRQSVSNLLNMTDGLLSDCLSIQIIATFNTSRDRIDKALLRKGRLIAEWKFDPLSVEDTNKLLESIGRSERSDKPLTLTEIYNMDEEVNVVQQERRTIGFSR